MNTAISAHLENQLRLLRVTLELTSPLALASGDSSGLFDSPCAVDANSLPCLPGTSLAGAMRAWWRTQLSAAHPDQDWFGFVPTGDQGAAAQRSRLHISIGHIHDAKNQPVDKPVARPQLHADPILGPLLGAHMPVREHVRLNDRGAAADTAKFDRSHVPAGHRFTFQIQLRLRTDNAASWEAARNALLAALKNGDIMLGGATRTGLGRITVKEARELLIKLPADVEKVSAHQSLTSSFKAPNLVETLPPTRPATQAVPDAPLEIQLELAARDLWRVGSSGVETLTMTDDSQADRQPDTQPYSEHWVNWINGQGKVETRKIVPGAGIKGALAHRTTFHLNRRSGRWATQDGEQAPLSAVTALFGQALDDGSGHAGCVHVSDSVLLPTQPSGIQHQPHVRLDRFTGGAWNGALFSESLISKGGILLRLRVSPQRLLAPSSPATGAELLALADALTDLGQGRLSLGAGAARGLGRFQFVNEQAAKKALADLENLGNKISTQRAQQANTTAQPTTQVQAHA